MGATIEQRRGLTVLAEQHQRRVQDGHRFGLLLQLGGRTGDVPMATDVSDRIFAPLTRFGDRAWGLHTSNYNAFGSRVGNSATKD
jgi:hypothetical protein